jgi:hypothetical protein
MTARREQIDSFVAARSTQINNVVHQTVILDPITFHNYHFYQRILPEQHFMQLVITATTTRNGRLIVNNQQYLEEFSFKEPAAGTRCPRTELIISVQY